MAEARIIVEVSKQLKKDAQQLALDLDISLKEVVSRALDRFLYHVNEEEKELPIK